MTRGLSDPLSDGAELPALGGRVALASWASRWPGLPAGKVARLLGQLGVTITPGWGTQALAWTTRRLQPPTPRWSAARGPARSSPRIETGWRVGGRCRATNGW
jgi:hypothetical protein